MTAKEFWKQKFDEEPQTDADKLAVAMMQEYHNHEITTSHQSGAATFRRIIEGTWPPDCIQRAFVEGASWWQFHHNGSTMFSSERKEAEEEAVRRYGEPSA